MRIPSIQFFQKTLTKQIARKFYPKISTMVVRSTIISYLVNLLLKVSLKNQMQRGFRESSQILLKIELLDA